jgi:hypothetical protein
LCRITLGQFRDYLGAGGIDDLLIFLGVAGFSRRIEPGTGACETGLAAMNDLTGQSKACSSFRSLASSLVIDPLFCALMRRDRPDSRMARVRVARYPGVECLAVWRFDKHVQESGLEQPAIAATCFHWWIASIVLSEGTERFDDPRVTFTNMRAKAKAG